ncbi:MAG: hypothetical protein VYA84_14750 [Planctomycetota bacterium]|nr:hypothetical protein [Planctomycetota bacterium]
MRQETIVNVFPSSDENRRLVIAVEQSAKSASRLVLRQETFSSDVGWFVQSQVAIEPDQVPVLKMSLGSAGFPGMKRPPRDLSRVPAILQFNGAAPGTAG